MCEIEHVFGMVASHWQLVNADVDDDQRHSTLLLDPLLRRLILSCFLVGAFSGGRPSGCHGEF